MLKPEMQENLSQQDISGSEQENKEPGLELVHGEELDTVVDVSNDLAGKMERDEKVTGDDVLRLDEALGKVKVDFYGDKMTVGEIKKIPDLLDNIMRFDGILEGSYEPGRTLTFITTEIAHILVGGENLFGIRLLVFDNLEAISDEVVLILSKSGMNLYLDNVKYLSDKSIQYLLDREKGRTSLLGLNDLSSASVEIIKKHPKRNIKFSETIERKLA